MPQKIIDYTKHLVDGNLTSDGVQWSTEVDTTTADADVTVLSVTVASPIKNIPAAAKFLLLEIECGLRAAFRAVSSATADLIWKWQIRNEGGTWVDLHSAQTETDIGTTYVEKSMSGYFTVQTNITEMPFDIRLLLQCNELNEGRGKVKNSSYVRVLARHKL